MTIEIIYKDETERKMVDKCFQLLINHKTSRSRKFDAVESLSRFLKHQSFRDKFSILIEREEDIKVKNYLQKALEKGSLELDLDSIFQKIEETDSELEKEFIEEKIRMKQANIKEVNENLAIYRYKAQYSSN